MIRTSLFQASLAVCGWMIVCFAAAPAIAADAPDFGSHWQDGRAELNGYRWTCVRYGEERAGRCVMIFVTEPFSESMLVKVDDPAGHPESDVFEALKLNLVREFQTGIYNYNTMTSVFVRSDDFTPAKISFTSAEWCGHVYEELQFTPRGIARQYFSYFGGESATQTLDREQDGLVEDDLFIRLRSLRGDWMRPGEKRSVPFLPGAFAGRLSHQPPRWLEAEIERRIDLQTVEVPAGSYLTAVYVVTTVDGRRGTFHVENEYPHRIVRWSWESADGEQTDTAGFRESGELTGSARLAYWQLHGNGHESYLEELGLSAR